MTLDSIIERLERAECGDREADAIIWATLEGMEVFEDGSTIYCEFQEGKRHYLGYIDPGKAQRNFSLAVGNEKVLKFTSSVDAAIALAEKLGLGCSVVTDPPSARVWSLPWADHDIERQRIVEAASPAVALAIAILKAKQMGVGE